MDPITKDQLTPTTQEIVTPIGLTATLNKMSITEQKEWGDGIAKALRARNERSTDNPTVRGKIWFKRNGGKSTSVAAVMDSGCTHPIMTTTVTDALNMKVTPLEKPLEIVEASGKNLKIMGTIKTYLECEVLGGRQ